MASRATLAPEIDAVKLVATENALTRVCRVRSGGIDPINMPGCEQTGHDHSQEAQATHGEYPSMIENVGQSAIVVDKAEWLPAPSLCKEI